MALPSRKKTVLLLIAGTLFYLLLSYHIIIVKGSPKLLKKSTLTLEYTFFSTEGKTNKTILAIDPLRKDGIGGLLIKEGLMSEEEEAEILESLNIHYR
jgi:hypothetical protein